MAEWLYPTAFSSWGPSEKSAIERVVRSGQFTMGPEVQAFEEEFAAWHGMKRCVMVNSGSSANLLMIAALCSLHQGLERGDRATVPALAWSTTYAPLVQHGIEIGLADCDLTWNAEPANMGMFSPRLIVGCSILGNPTSVEWAQAAAAMGAFYIEDNCESLGALMSDEAKCGTKGVMNSFSFFWSHQIGAVEGGAILTDNENLAEILKVLRSHGWTRDVKKPESFEQEYDFQAFGYNLRPVEMHAAIAREQLRKLPNLIANRRDNTELFWREITAAGAPIVRPAVGGMTQSPFGIQFVVPMGTRQRLVEALRCAGIDCRLPTGGSFGKHVYGRGWAKQHTPMADHIHDNGMFIGNPPWHDPDRIGNAVTVIAETYSA